jgi:hypothetical protein
MYFRKFPGSIVAITSHQVDAAHYRLTAYRAYLRFPIVSTDSRCIKMYAQCYNQG